MGDIELTERQERIVQIVKSSGPITGEQIAEMLNLTRATLRPDLAILTMSGVLEARPRVGYYYSNKAGQSLVGKQISRLRVKDIQARPIILKGSASILDGVVALFTEDTSAIFVVDEDGYLDGVVSRKDFLRAAMAKWDASKMPINMIMTRMPNLITVGPDDPVPLAAKKLIEHEIDALPVVRTFVDDEGKERHEVIGRITKSNITRLFVELCET